MKKTGMMKYAAIGMVIGAGVGAMIAPKPKTVRTATVKAARAVASMVDSIASSMGL